MLQRAASNAYSWWWASHIRTKQSKWLDSNLLEMEERVKSMVKLIEPDADSFGKRAELYFRRRPELINLVEDTYKAYKALADKYDRISGELHKANHTIATAFPDHIPFEIQDDDDDDTPKALTSIDASKFSQQLTEVPQLSLLNMDTESSPDMGKPHHKKKITSHISKEKALEEIDRLQKEILVLQTEKEFVKSSYENGLAKYMDIERQITEKQEEVVSLQDAFSASAVIEDEEARALMAARAIKSCEDTLVNLQEQQRKSSEEERIESKRIKDAERQLKSLKGECGNPHMENEDNHGQETKSSSSTVKVDEDDCGPKVGRMELQMICQKLKEHFELSSETSVVELAEKIDELVDKVINLELTVSSQSAQINTLRSQTDNLQKNLHSLEEEKMALIGDSNVLTERLKRAEEELQSIRQLERCVHTETCKLQAHLTKACHSFNNLSERLQSPKLLNQENASGSSENRVPSPFQDSKHDNLIQGEHHESRAVSNPETLSKLLQADSFDKGYDASSEAHSQLEGQENPRVWQDLLLNGLEGKEKILLADYASVLHNYKDTKRRLSEMEKRNQEYHHETMTQVKELKSANDMKDEEIRSLRRILSSLQARYTVNAPLNLEKSEEAVQSVAKPSMPLEIGDKENLHAEEDIKLCQIEELHAFSPLDVKFRVGIDSLLEENLNFWLRFSTSYHQIQNFQSTFNKLQAEMEKLKDTKSQECKGPSVAAGEQVGKEEPVPLDKKLRELNTDLQIWLEKNMLLKGELQCRFASLCTMREEIESISKMSQTEDMKFIPYQTAKFQGEVLNMQQENNKVAKELEAGLDHVRSLQTEVGRALLKFRENFELCGAQSDRQNNNHSGNISTKTRIPLRTFLFGAKPKHKKPSLFSCMNPALQKRHTIARTGFPT